MNNFSKVHEIINSGDILLTIEDGDGKFWKAHSAWEKNIIYNPYELFIVYINNKKFDLSSEKVSTFDKNNISTIEIEPTDDAFEKLMKYDNYMVITEHHGQMPLSKYILHSSIIEILSPLPNYLYITWKHILQNRSPVNFLDTLVLFTNRATSIQLFMMGLKNDDEINDFVAVLQDNSMPFVAEPNISQIENSRTFFRKPAKFYPEFFIDCSISDSNYLKLVFFDKCKIIQYNVDNFINFINKVEMYF